uniref:Uncharacterized protein n=1 Tax=Anopheles coluzzii TaxID=1518534 RepID=A0A8W7P6J9_ANOCL
MAHRVHCSSASLMISVLSGSSSAAPWLASPAGCAVLCCAELRVIMRRFLGSVTSDVDVAFPVDAAGTTVESSGGDEEDGSAGRFVPLASFDSFSFSPADTFVVDVGDATRDVEADEEGEDEISLNSNEAPPVASSSSGGGNGFRFFLPDRWGFAAVRAFSSLLDRGFAVRRWCHRALAGILHLVLLLALLLQHAGKERAHVAHHADQRATELLLELEPLLLQREPLLVECQIFALYRNELGEQGAETGRLAAGRRTPAGRARFVLLEAHLAGHIHGRYGDDRGLAGDRERQLGVRHRGGQQLGHAGGRRFRGGRQYLLRFAILAHGVH